MLVVAEVGRVIATRRSQQRSSAGRERIDLFVVGASGV
jgi:hypothetical protein